MHNMHKRFFFNNSQTLPIRMEGLDTKRSQRYAMSTSTNHSINIKRVENRCHLAQKKPMRAYAKSRKSVNEVIFLATDAINPLVPSDCALVTPASVFSHAV